MRNHRDFILLLLLALKRSSYVLSSGDTNQYKSKENRKDGVYNLVMQAVNVMHCPLFKVDNRERERHSLFCT